MAAMNGTAGAHGGEDYQQWMEGKAAQGKASPQSQRHGGDVYSNTLPVRKAAPAKSKTTLSKTTDCCNVGPNVQEQVLVGPRRFREVFQAPPGSSRLSGLTTLFVPQTLTFSCF